MAFKDQNGQITINEIAAQKDIRNLQKSKENLYAAISDLKEIIGLASEFSGNTGVVITETTLLLQKQMETTISFIDDTTENIDSTVKKYQAIDSNLKDIINGTKIN